MLLIMGLGGQLIVWEDEFCLELAGRGFHVIRYDNRDVGLSTKFDDRPVPDVMEVIQGDHSSVAYSLDDMAQDAVGLLDALGIERANVVGASMGGMIAQLVAINHPERVLSLASIMSTTGDPAVGAPTAEAISVLVTTPPEGREATIEHEVETTRLIGSPGFPFDEERVRRRAAAAYDRSFYPAGVVRQVAAVILASDRTERLGRIDVPTVVIHGSADPLVTLSGGEATAKAIPGAELVVIDGLGHEVQPGARPTIIGAIVANASRRTLGDRS
jgi:pimeloyl-ACP methyl ester carboxylesterase